MGVEFKDNSAAVKSAMNSAKAAALEAIGLKWQETVTKEITSMGAVDTGRMRASMTYQVDKPNDRVVVGTNVEYAPYVNFGTHRMAARPFMENSVLNHREDYQEIAEQALGKGVSVSSTNPSYK